MGEVRNPGRCCARKSQSYPQWKVDPENINAGPLAYLVSYFEHLAPSSVYSECSTSDFKLGFAGPPGM